MMAGRELAGPFAPDIARYVSLTESAGCDASTILRRLAAFDAYTSELHAGAESLTREIAEGWCTLRDGESPQTLSARACALNGFARYLRSEGADAYVIPPGYCSSRSDFVPYIYTDEEIGLFFAGADSLGPHPLSPFREYVVPVMFRMLYCCGLRPQEVVALRVGDADLDAGMLYIEESKGHKDRRVAMSADLVGLCRRYESAMSALLPGREWLFESPGGGPYRIAWAQSQFRKCWRAAGVEFDGCRRPRLYDFRHNFACRVVAGWMEDGVDAMGALPRLSAYMGHSDSAHTAYYIHLVPDHAALRSKASWGTDAGGAGDGHGL